MDPINFVVFQLSIQICFASDGVVHEPGRCRLWPVLCAGNSPLFHVFTLAAGVLERGGGGVDKRGCWKHSPPPAFSF